MADTHKTYCLCALLYALKNLVNVAITGMLEVYCKESPFHTLINYTCPPSSSAPESSLLNVFKINPLMSTVVIWVQLAIKHPVPDRVKLSFVIFWHPGTLTLRAERQSARMSKNYKWQLNPVWHRMLHSRTHMAAVDVKGLKQIL